MSRAFHAASACLSTSTSRNQARMWSNSLRRLIHFSDLAGDEDARAGGERERELGAGKRHGVEERVQSRDVDRGQLQGEHRDDGP